MACISLLMILPEVGYRCCHETFIVDGNCSGMMPVNFSPNLAKIHIIRPTNCQGLVMPSIECQCIRHCNLEVYRL